MARARESPGPPRARGDAFCRRPAAAGVSGARAPALCATASGSAGAAGPIPHHHRPGRRRRMRQALSRTGGMSWKIKRMGRALAADPGAAAATGGFRGLRRGGRFRTKEPRRGEGRRPCHRDALSLPARKRFRPCSTVSRGIRPGAERVSRHMPGRAGRLCLDPSERTGNDRATQGGIFPTQPQGPQ